MKDYKEELEQLQARKTRLECDYYAYEDKVTQAKREVDRLIAARDSHSDSLVQVRERIKEVEHILELEEKASGR